MIDSLSPKDIVSIPIDIQKTGVFVNAPVSYINDMVKVWQLDDVQGEAPLVEVISPSLADMAAILPTTQFFLKQR